jgi:hypothetical protein
LFENKLKQEKKFKNFFCGKKKSFCKLFFILLMDEELQEYEEEQSDQYDDSEEEEEEEEEYEEEELPTNSTRLPTYNKQKDIVGYTIVDTEDLPRLKGLTLTQMVGTKGYISVFVIVNAKPLTLSHFIDGIPPSGFVKDHHNCNSLDNRKVNLSNVSRSQNAQNKTKDSNASSRYSGVSWNKAEQK